MCFDQLCLFANLEIRYVDPLIIELISLHKVKPGLGSFDTDQNLSLFPALMLFDLPLTLNSTLFDSPLIYIIYFLTRIINTCSPTLFSNA